MTELTIDELDHEICSLAARINTATAQLLLLVGEFDLREGWAGHGVKSCAQWLSWKCHIGTHAAREQVRIARALRGLAVATYRVRSWAAFVLSDPRADADR